MLAAQAGRWTEARPAGGKDTSPGVAGEGEGREGAGGVSGLAQGSRGLWVVGPTLPALQPGLATWTPNRRPEAADRLSRC